MAVTNQVLVSLWGAHLQSPSAGHYRFSLASQPVSQPVLLENDGGRTQFFRGLIAFPIVTNAIRIWMIIIKMYRRSPGSSRHSVEGRFMACQNPAIDTKNSLSGGILRLFLFTGRFRFYCSLLTSRASASPFPSPFPNPNLPPI